MIKPKHIFVFVISLFFVSFIINKKESSSNDSNNPVRLLTNHKQFMVGHAIVLQFSYKNTPPLYLYCSNSYGSTVLDGQILPNNTMQFTLPTYMSCKTGVVHWKLLAITENIEGNFEIQAQKEPKTLETYLGPPSIEAGGKDFTMMVIIPTDEYDNPIKNNSKVTIHHQFLTSEKTEDVFTNNLIAYQNIYAPTKSGRISLSSNCIDLNSKEYNVNVEPAISVNFTITAHRHHEYADGNQITTFTSSIIKDSYGNIISDGSFVDFFITNSKGNILKTSGTTVNGIATAKMIHPDYEDSWSIKAYVVGISESNTLNLQYKKVIDSFDVYFNNNNRSIKVGPLKSFMNQMIPDGLEVHLSIYKNDELIKQYSKESREGFVNFTLSSHVIKNDTYTVHITTAGITQTYKNKKLW